MAEERRTFLPQDIKGAYNFVVDAVVTLTMIPMKLLQEDGERVKRAIVELKQVEANLLRKMR